MTDWRQAVLRAGAVLAAFFTAAVLLQCLGGAYHSEFGAHPDEPSHVVTSLLVRDYVASGIPQHPMRFAENYYAHYPKAALGHWPPVYYVVQAAWNLAFPATRVSILLCHALIVALFAALFFRWARDYFPMPVALTASVWLLAQPWVQWLTVTVMLDVAVALFMLLAALAYAGYLRDPGWRPAAWFSVWACAAILTKGTGVALALLPVYCLLLTRRIRLVTRASFWLPAIAVAAICGPWYWLAPEAMQQRSGAYGAPSAQISYLVEAVQFWTAGLGMILPALALVGLISRRRAFRLDSRGDAQWAAGIALFCSAATLLLFVRSARETRNLVTLMGPLILFATAGIARLLEWLSFRKMGSRWSVALTAAVLIVWSGVNARGLPLKTPAGYIEAAAYLTHAPQYRESVFLISGDPADEGMFISEVALAERRPSHIVLRASKVLGSSTWEGKSYSSKFQQVEPLDQYLRSVPVGILVLQKNAARQRLHHDLLGQMVAAQPTVWRLIGDYPHARVYELAGHQSMPRRGVSIRLSDKLGKDVRP